MKIEINFQQHIFKFQRGLEEALKVLYR